MIDSPKVSIILVNYNGYEDTIDCLRSLRDIIYPNYDVIVIDNASTNESVDKIGEYVLGNETLILSEINGGFSAGNNIGIRYALEHGADYCLLLNNDTVVEPNFLDGLIQVFQIHPECGLSIGKIVYESKKDTIWYAGGSIDFKTARTTHWNYREPDEGLASDIQEVTFATGCCMCVPRKVIEKIGVMEENYFMYVEDVEYCIKIQNAGYKLLYVPESRIYHKVSASAGTSSPFAQYYSIRNKYMLIKRNFDGINKVTAFCYTSLQHLFRCFSQGYSLKTLVKAFMAYLKKEAGKSMSI